MILRDLLQLVLFICLLAALSPLLGRYVHQVFSGRRTFLHPVLGPVERGVYTLSGIHPDEKQTWGQYAVSVIGFSLAGFLLTFGVLLFQDKLPLNPQGFPGLSWHLALNTAVSFLTNTNWQSYGGETTVSHFSQMVALTYQNFVSAGVGIAVCAVVWYFLVRMRKVPWFAVAIVGILAWVMMFEAGVHPTLAGVLVGLLTPAHECYGEKTPRAERYADKLQPFSALLALPIFALFATGVHFESLTLALFVSPVVVAVMVALVVGKPLGIMITAWLSTHVAGLKMAKGLRVRDMFPAACACGIGFTVSFLISSLAYKDAELSAEARFGVLVGSMVAAVISGILLSRQSKKFELTAAASSKHKHHTADEDAAGEVESVLEDGTVVVSQMINTHPKVK